jgi:integrase
MAMREVKGLHRIKDKTGAVKYVYAWRGGPRLTADEGTPAFWAQYDAAIRELQLPDQSKFRALVTDYKVRGGYQKIGERTKKQWSRWLDRIAEYFGDLSIAQFNRPEKIRPEIRQWRNKYADTPRAADMGMQVLSVVCSHGVEVGKLASNPCEGIKALYSGDRSDIIWTDADLARIRAVAPVDVVHAIDLAVATGLRRGALQRLAWAHVRETENYIEMPQLPGHKRTGLIPLYAELRALLARIPKRATTVLTNSKGRPWTDVGLGNAMMRAKEKAGIGSELHFHDLRGTAATRFYTAGLDKRVIAEILSVGPRTPSTASFANTSAAMRRRRQSSGCSIRGGRDDPDTRQCTLAGIFRTVGSRGRARRLSWQDWRAARRILATMGFDVEGTLAVFAEHGGCCCDCEVLMNVEDCYAVAARRQN